MADREMDWIKGLLVGGLIGAALGILFAPKSGRETREDIARKTDELLAKAREEYEKAAEKSRIAYEEAAAKLKAAEGVAREKAGELEGKLGQLATQGMESLAENKSRLKRAIDAGVETYREEKNKTSV